MFDVSFLFCHFLGNVLTSNDILYRVMIRVHIVNRPISNESTKSLGIKDKKKKTTSQELLVALLVNIHVFNFLAYV
jgi:hypothetical protein